MANRQQFESSTQERNRRSFSESFKKEKVREVEQGRARVSEIVKQYEVSSVSVYRWLSKFGAMKNKAPRTIVETDSDTRELLALKKKVAELERIVGQKQILLDFKDKMIELAEQEYGVDIKKKYSTTPSATTGSSGSSTPLL
jgi:transposase